MSKCLDYAVIKWDVSSKSNVQEYSCVKLSDIKSKNPKTGSTYKIEYGDSQYNGLVISIDTKKNCDDQIEVLTTYTQLNDSKTKGKAKASNNKSINNTTKQNKATIDNNTSLTSKTINNTTKQGRGAHINNTNHTNKSVNSSTKQNKVASDTNKSQTNKSIKNTTKQNKSTNSSNVIQNANTSNTNQANFGISEEVELLKKKCDERDEIIGNLREKLKVRNNENEKLKKEIAAAKEMFNESDQRKLIKLSLNVLQAIGSKNDLAQLSVCTDTEELAVLSKNYPDVLVDKTLKDSHSSLFDTDATTSSIFKKFVRLIVKSDVELANSNANVLFKSYPRQIAAIIDYTSTHRKINSKSARKALRELCTDTRNKKIKKSQNATNLIVQNKENYIHSNDNENAGIYDTENVDDDNDDGANGDDISDTAGNVSNNTVEEEIENDEVDNDDDNEVDDDDDNEDDHDDDVDDNDDNNDDDNDDNESDQDIDAIINTQKRKLKLSGANVLKKIKLN